MSPPPVTLLVLLALGTGGSRAPATATDNPPSQARAEASLDLARLYLRTGQVELAKGVIAEVLRAQPQNKHARELYVQVIEVERQRLSQKQHRVLDIAQTLIEHGDRDKALTLIHQVAESAAVGTPLRLRADSLMMSAYLGWWDRIWSKFSAWPDVLAVVLPIAFIWIILWIGIRIASSLRLRSHRRRPVWLVEPISDLTQRGIAELVLSDFRRLSTERPPWFAGLLRIGGRPLIHPSLALTGPGSRPALELEGMAEAIGGGAAAAAARVLNVLISKWRTSRPAIRGTAVAVDNGVVIRLTAYGVDGTIRSISAHSDSEGDPDAGVIAAEKAATRMYYLLAHPDTADGAANALQEGIGFLTIYARGQDGSTLTKALQSFGTARAIQPSMLEAFLYEGVTLDLLERHDEAESRFIHVRERSAADDPLHEKALYNLAVAQMRQYKPDALRKAADSFKAITNARPDTPTQPIGVLARAGHANVVAHYPIFWERLLYGRKAIDNVERQQWKEKSWDEIQKWIKEVTNITTEAEQELERSKRTGDQPAKVWDDGTERQIKWAIANARGNIYLNVGDGFLEPPRPTRPENPEQIQREYLEKALKEFQECELLLPPGVETLTNIATTLLFLGRYDASRRYSRRAIDLNRDYEYASFRLAHAWDRESRPAQASEVLKTYKGGVRIAEFRALFEKYDVPVPVI